MPKAFTTKQKAKIREALMDAGLAEFSARGVRAARVEDICAAVGIAKGSFYAFFPSKEDLFMTIADGRDTAHKADIRAYLEGQTETAAEAVAGFFDFTMKRIETDPVLAVIRDRGELSYLVRKVSPELLAENARRDRAFIAEITGLLRRRHGLDRVRPKTLESVMGLMLALGVQAGGFGDAIAEYGAMRSLLRDMTVAHLTKEADR